MRTHALNAVGLLVLISSTIIVGYGNYLGTLSPTPGERPAAENRPVAGAVVSRHAPASDRPTVPGQ